MLGGLEGGPAGLAAWLWGEGKSLEILKKGKFGLRGDLCAALETSTGLQHELASPKKSGLLRSKR